MGRILKVTGFFVLGLGIAAAWIYFPFIHGLAAAMRDHRHGVQRLYQLGCVIGPSKPREPAAFRYEEILRERYSLTCEGIGGFAPSEDTVRFATAYNAATMLLVRKRFDRSFLWRTYNEATRDVAVREVSLRGCLTGHELILPSGERLVVWATAPIADSDLLALTSAPVVASGKLTEVRFGKWNERFGRRLVAERLASDPGGRCAQQGVTRSAGPQKSIDARLTPPLAPTSTAAPSS